MFQTGNATGVHVHYEIRKSDNKYANVNNPATYMGIPNKVATGLNTENYQLSTPASSTPVTSNSNELKTL